jgi:hypothetical protein
VCVCVSVAVSDVNPHSIPIVRGAGTESMSEIMIACEKKYKKIDFYALHALEDVVPHYEGERPAPGYCQ